MVLRVGIEHVDDGLRREPRHSRTAEVIDTSDQVIRKAGQQMLLFLTE